MFSDTVGDNCTRGEAEELEQIQLATVRMATSATSDVFTEWADVQRNFWDWRMRVSPEFSTYTGVYRYNDRITPKNISHYTVMKKEVDTFLQHLKIVDRTALGRSEKMDFDILQDLLQTFSDAYRWVEYAPVNPINFLDGPQLNPGSDIPFDNRGDFENYLSRLEQYPFQISEIIENFRTAVRLGHTLHNVSIDRVPAQIDEALRTNPEHFVYYRPFIYTLNEISSISPNDKANMRQRAKNSITRFMRALENLRDYITYEYLPQTRSEYGVGAWGNGEFYKACLRWHLSVDMGPEEVHDIGRREVERIKSEMDQTMRRLNFTGTIREFFTQTKENPKFTRKSSDEILQLYRNMSEQIIQPKLPTIFKNMPDMDFSILKMPNDGTSGSYVSGSDSDARSGTFFVNLHRPQEILTFNLMPLLLHETIPGHHLQAIYSQATNLENYRKHTNGAIRANVPVAFPTYTAYIEGWALYAEMLGEELGLYKDDYELMGRYEWEILRACRLVIDTGLHMYNWTREHAVQYLMDHTAHGRTKAEHEIDRYITWPGQACAYKIGELRIKDIRSKAKNRLGDKFDIRDFHSVILNNGPVPLRLLERVVDDWVEDIEAAHRLSSLTTQKGKECY
ncbi:hypothetical protein ScPMuIL_018912 [Solemya velum]